MKKQSKTKFCTNWVVLTKCLCLPVSVFYVDDILLQIFSSINVKDMALSLLVDVNWSCPYCVEFALSHEQSFYCKCPFASIAWLPHIDYTTFSYNNTENNHHLENFSMGHCNMYCQERMLLYYLLYMQGHLHDCSHSNYVLIILDI